MSLPLGIWMFPALMVLLLTGFPIAFSMMAVALVFGLMTFGDIALFQMVSKVDAVASNSILAAIPLFVFMGAVLEKSGIAERLFDAVHIWTRRLPGGLAVGTVVMATIFAAATGVVGATETVIGMIAIPVMLKYHYDKKLISGTICAGGSLGTVIPPSITVIVLGPVANVSIGDLFAGLMIPGLIMSLLFIIYIIGLCMWNRDVAPRIEEEVPMTLLQKIGTTAFALVPPLLLILLVLGSILAGMATPTEAAACGAVGSLVLAAMYGNLNLGLIRMALPRTLTITSMILLIVVAGNMFAGIFFASGGMIAVQSLLNDLGFPAWGVIALLLGLTFIAGFLLDLISVVLILIPVAMPLVNMYGVDPIWFCIAFLVVLQTSYITPPMAPSIFYMRAIAPDSIKLIHMYKGVLPFIALELIVLALVIIFPQLALWLPDQLRGL